MTMAAGTAAYLSVEAVRAAGGQHDSGVLVADASGSFEMQDASNTSLTEPMLSNGQLSSLSSQSINRSGWLYKLNNLLRGGSKKQNTSNASRARALYDQKADVYSFAILMYVVLTENTRPYGTMSDLDVIARQMKEGNLRPKLEGESLVAAAYEHGHGWYIDLMK
jgi:Protein tyrosine and serine/threonine kinase